MNATWTPLSAYWREQFDKLVRDSEHELLLVSPYISARPLKRIVSSLLQKRTSPPHVHILTNLSENALRNNSLDVEALVEFLDRIEMTTITHLPSLHAKVYIADTRAAIVTSANLTNGGLWNNREYGFLVRDVCFVRRMREDINGYITLGNTVPRRMLQEIADETQHLQAARRDLTDSASDETRSRLSCLLNQTQTKVLQARARGKTTHGIFMIAILYLLDRHGPLTTSALHPLVQGIHPDLCDDNVDRVIDGVHFGKKWKHHVRNAQQRLKAQNRIELRSDGRWHLV